MSKVSEIGKGVVHGAVVAEHAVVKAVTFLPKAAALVADAIKDQPKVKAAVLELIAEGAAAVKDSEVAIASDGANFVADALVIKDAETFFLYFKSTFMPLIEAIYAEVKADTK